MGSSDSKISWVDRDFYQFSNSPNHDKFPWLPPHAADPGGLGYALCLKHQRRSSHGRPKAPNLHFIFLSGAVYIRGATLFKYTGCGACEGGHYRNLFPVFFDHFGTHLGAFRSFSVWGVPRQPLGAPPGRRRGPKVTLGGVFVIPLPRFGVFWRPLGRAFHCFFGVVFRRALFGCPGRRFDTQSARKGSPVIPPEVGLL